MALLHILLLLVLSLEALVSRSQGKVLRGEVSSRSAWDTKGIFLAKFGFHDRKAVFRYETNDTNDGKWYFYLDDHWPAAIAETNCYQKLGMARFTMPISSKQGEQYVNQWMRPHFWYVVYADPRTCEPNPPTEDHSLTYTLYFFNPDSFGDSVDHFGEDERGLLLMYTLLIILYIAGISFFAKRVIQTIQKGGPMHEVLQMLSVAMAMHFMAAMFMLIHLWIFKNDGVGSGVCETLSEILNVLAELIMAWMMLSMSLGWTLGSSIHPFKHNKQLGIIISVAITEIVLVLWEHSYQESHYTYHIHENLPGLLMVLLRIGLSGLFAYNLKFTIANEKSTLKQQFYHSFSFACYLWFLAFPALMLIAMVFPQYWRHRVVTIGTVAIQSVSMLMLSKQFLSRSLYWEVSSLSSTTLPFRRERGGIR